MLALLFIQNKGYLSNFRKLPKGVKSSSRGLNPLESRLIKNSKGQKKSTLEAKLNKASISKTIDKTEIKKAVKAARKDNSALFSTNYLPKSKNFLSLKSTTKGLYTTFVNYMKKYKRKEKKPYIEPDCWQIGIEFSQQCYLIFFPKKQKNISGLLKDKGIMLHYIYVQPALSNF